MVTLASGLRDLSANSGQMQHLLALNAPATGELVESLGPAGPGVDNMAFYAALCAAGLAAALLLVAGALHLTGVVVLIGLLLLQISAPQWRNTLREAFRD